MLKNVDLRCELILGGQKSGKSRRAELLARDWLAAETNHEALFVATAHPADEELAARIARHRADRARRVPGMPTLECHLDLAHAIRTHSEPHRLVVIDCLTLWLTNWLMPGCVGLEPVGQAAFEHQRSAFLLALADAAGPVVMVSNEIGLGVIPLGVEVRHFVDQLGLLNQAVASHCERVSLMVAGFAVAVKGGE